MTPFAAKAALQEPGGQSMEIFAPSATAFQWAASFSTWALNSSGNEPTAISPMSVRRLCSSGDLTIALTSAPSLSTMGFTLAGQQVVRAYPLGAHGRQHVATTIQHAQRPGAVLERGIGQLAGGGQVQISMTRQVWRSLGSTGNANRSP